MKRATSSACREETLQLVLREVRELRELLTARRLPQPAAAASDEISDADLDELLASAGFERVPPNA